MEAYLGAGGKMFQRARATAEKALLWMPPAGLSWLTGPTACLLCWRRWSKPVPLGVRKFLKQPGPMPSRDLKVINQHLKLHPKAYQQLWSSGNMGHLRAPKTFLHHRTLHQLKLLNGQGSPMFLFWTATWLECLVSEKSSGHFFLSCFSKISAPQLKGNTVYKRSVFPWLAGAGRCICGCLELRMTELKGTMEVF